MTAHTLIVFDLDGTLVDTAPDLIATLNVILAREGLAPVALDNARALIGGGARKLLERGFALAGRAPLEAEMKRLTGAFIEHYARHIAEHSRPFPGVTEALDALAAAGCRFAVCTNKLEWLAKRLLATLAMAERFDAICGGDTFGAAKPDARPLRNTILRAGGTLERAIMVGDSVADVGAARSAGIPVIGVTFGYTDIPITELACDHVIDHFAALPAAVAALRRHQAMGSA